MLLFLSTSSNAVAAALFNVSNTFKKGGQRVREAVSFAEEPLLMHQIQWKGAVGHGDVGLVLPSANARIK